jgi:hypothetical protein
MQKHLALAGVGLIGYLAGALLVSASPLVVGVAVVSLVPGLGGLRAGVPPFAVAGWVMVVLVLAVVLDTPLSRLATRPFVAHERAGTLAAEAVSLGFLWLLLRPIMASGWSTLLAASIGVVFYKAAEPLLDRWARADRRGEGPAED